MSVIRSSSRHFSDVRLKFGRAKLNMKLFQFWLKVSFPRPLGTLPSLPKTSGALDQALFCCLPVFAAVFLLHVPMQVAGALLLQPAAHNMTLLTACWDGSDGAGWTEGSVHGERCCVSFLSYFFLLYSWLGICLSFAFTCQKHQMFSAWT